MLKDYQFKFHQCKVGRFIMDSAKFQPIILTLVSQTDLDIHTEIHLFPPPRAFVFVLQLLSSGFDAEFF